MNINLKATSLKKTKKIGFGLNNRKNKKKSIFNDSSDEDSPAAGSGGKEDSATARQVFNKELAAEQAALRSRAEKAMRAAATTNATNDSNANVINVNDYDAEYESFGHLPTNTNAQENNSIASKQDDVKPRSKYVQSLLVKAKERTYEREIVLERKIAKEQAQEEASEEYKGKDKFITKSYKVKLQERANWLEQEELKQKRDEDGDVTKKAAGAAIMGFYGNLSRIGGGAEGPTDGINSEAETGKARNSFNNQASHVVDEMTHRDGQRNPMSSSAATSSSQRRRIRDDRDEVVEDLELEEELGHQSKRIQRLQSIFRARERYLERKADREAALNSAQ